MPFNGGGVFSRLYNWVTDATSGIPMTPSRFDADTNDIAAGLSQCITRNGQSTPTANLPMGGFKLTGVAKGIATGDSASYDNLTDPALAGLMIYQSSATGAAARSLQSKIQEVVSVADFGATTALLDASTAINLALTYAGTVVQNTTSGSGSVVTCDVYLPPGVWTIANTINIPEGVRLRGAGQAVSILKYTGTGVGVQMGDTSVVNGTAYKANIQGLDWGIYSTVGGTGTICIQSTNCIRNCGLERVQAYSAGINFNQTNTANWTFRLIDCNFHDAVVNNCYLRACNSMHIIRGRYDTAGADNIVLDGINTNDILDFVFEGPTIQGAQFNGVKMIDCSHVKFTAACDIEGNGLAGSGYSDVVHVHGSRAVNMEVLVYEFNFNSMGSSPGTNHRILDLSYVNVLIFESNKSGGGVTQNYDLGISFTTNVGLAIIRGCAFGGCTAPFTTTGTTQIIYTDVTGRTTIGDTRSNASTLLDLAKSVNGGNVSSFNNKSSTAGSVAVQSQVGTSTGTGYLFWGVNAISTNVFRVLDTGDVKNTNNAYGAISDAKLKNVLGPATSAWNDFKAYEWVKYTLKDDPTNLVQLGVIAQQVRGVSPGLVGESDDFTVDEEGNRIPTGTTTLDVKYSVLYAKACVVLQEAMKRIEALEARS